uniref:TIM44-like domain-containing protein n=1 Tax=Acetatifactor sp. TaxID=1872090 RepID=UPI00405646CB
MEYGKLIAIIIILVLLLVLVGIIYYAYCKIRDKVRSFSRMAFGTSDIVKGLKQVEMETAATPKSVSSATGLYLPSITRDFPDFHYEEMKTRAENVLISFLRSIDNRNPKLLTEGTSELKDSLELRLEMLARRNQKEYFQNIKIHRTEISRYQKIKGRCSVVLQSAVEYIHYTEENGKLVEGRKDRREQARYNVEVIYIQDRELVENAGDMGLAMNCPNCGAPLPKLGAKICEYCDSPVVEFNIRTWNFASVKES